MFSQRVELRLDFSGGAFHCLVATTYMWKGRDVELSLEWTRSEFKLLHFVISEVALVNAQ